MTCHSLDPGPGQILTLAGPESVLNASFSRWASSELVFRTFFFRSKRPVFGTFGSKPIDPGFVLISSRRPQIHKKKLKKPSVADVTAWAAYGVPHWTCSFISHLDPLRISIEVTDRLHEAS
jgi:hypothetical protein